MSVLCRDCTNMPMNGTRMYVYTLYLFLKFVPRISLTAIGAVILECTVSAVSEHRLQLEEYGPSVVLPISRNHNQLKE